MYRRLLLALDGSELSRAAIPRTVEAASGNETAIALLEVVPTRDRLRRTLAGSAFEFSGGDSEAIDELAASAHFRKPQEALDHLAQAEAELRDHGSTSVTTHVAEGQQAKGARDDARPGLGTRRGCCPGPAVQRLPTRRA